MKSKIHSFGVDFYRVCIGQAKSNSLKMSFTVMIAIWKKRVGTRFDPPIRLEAVIGLEKCWNSFVLLAGLESEGPKLCFHPINFVFPRALIGWALKIT